MIPYAEVTITCACPGLHVRGIWLLFGCADDDPEAHEKAAACEFAVLEAPVRGEEEIEEHDYRRN